MKYIQIKTIALIAIMTFMLFLSMGARADNSGVITYAAPESSIDTGTTSYAAPDSLSSPLVTSGGLSSSPSIDTGTTSDTQSYREKLVVRGIWILQKLCGLLGLLILVSGFLRLARWANAAGTQQRPSTSSIYAWFICGTLMFSYNSTLGTLITTFSGESGDGVCYVLESSDTKIASDSNCWSDASSEATGVLSAQITKKFGNSDASKEFSDNIKLIVGILQVIGFGFYISSIYGFMKVADGRAQHGYWKPSVMMISSMLIVDLPHTWTMVVATLAKGGVVIGGT